MPHFFPVALGRKIIERRRRSDLFAPFAEKRPELLERLGPDCAKHYAKQQPSDEFMALEAARYACGGLRHKGQPVGFGMHSDCVLQPVQRVSLSR